MRLTSMNKRFLVGAGTITAISIYLFIWMNAGISMEASVEFDGSQMFVSDPVTPSIERDRAARACGAACQRLADILRSFPHRKPKAAIYILAGRRYQKLQNIIRQIYKHFTRKFRYPVIVFHESDFIREKLDLGYCRDDCDVLFQEVTFRVPSYVNVSLLRETTDCSYHGIGYRHMCRFHSKTVYEEPIMRDLEFAWRLDDDSEILAPIGYDIVRFMRDRGLRYGYTLEGVDPERCVRGLENIARATLSSRNSTSHSDAEYARAPATRYYYNNFEISDVSLWRSAEYRRYIDEVDREGGIYYHRWGDAPIKSLAVRTLVPKSKIHRFVDVRYQHQRFRNDNSSGIVKVW